MVMAMHGRCIDATSESAAATTAADRWLLDHLRRIDPVPGLADRNHQRRRIGPGGHAQLAAVRIDIHLRGWIKFTDRIFDDSKINDGLSQIDMEFHGTPHKEGELEAKARCLRTLALCTRPTGGLRRGAGPPRREGRVPQGAACRSGDGCDLTEVKYSLLPCLLQLSGQKRVAAGKGRRAGQGSGWAGQALQAQGRQRPAKGHGGAVNGQVGLIGSIRT